jgi:hypothetical protein
MQEPKRALATAAMIPTRGTGRGEVTGAPGYGIVRSMSPPALGAGAAVGAGEDGAATAAAVHRIVSATLNFPADAEGFVRYAQVSRTPKPRACGGSTTCRGRSRSPDESLDVILS